MIKVIKIILTIDYMRIVVQRVLDASVTVDGTVVGKIGKGLLVLVGFTKGDGVEIIKDFVETTVNIKLWEKDGEQNEASLKDIDGEILVVSQFTLYGTLVKGTKPDFHNALGANQANKLYEEYVSVLKTVVPAEKVQTGQFQAMMVVRSTTDGPIIYIPQQSIKTQLQKLQPPSISQTISSCSFPHTNQ